MRLSFPKHSCHLGAQINASPSASDKKFQFILNSQLWHDAYALRYRSETSAKTELENSNTCSNHHRPIHIKYKKFLPLWFQVFKTHEARIALPWRWLHLPQGNQQNFDQLDSLYTTHISVNCMADELVFGLPHTTHAKIWQCRLLFTVLQACLNVT